MTLHFTSFNNYINAVEHPQDKFGPLSTYDIAHVRSPTSPLKRQTKMRLDEVLRKPKSLLKMTVQTVKKIIS